MLRCRQTNLANPKAVSDSAVRKAASVAKNAAAAAAAADPAAGESDASSTPKYIDRAAARREALGQPDHPAPEKKRRFEGPPPREPPAPPRPANVAIEETNVGSKMLEKMVSSATGRLFCGVANFLTSRDGPKALDSVLKAAAERNPCKHLNLLKELASVLRRVSSQSAARGSTAQHADEHLSRRCRRDL